MLWIPEKLQSLINIDNRFDFSQNYLSVFRPIWEVYVSSPMQSAQVLQKRLDQDFTEELRARGWYHSIDLPDGRVIPGYLSIEDLRERFAQFPLPADLSGKRVLDIGTWDGWFAFEAERRGADVVAIDNVEQENFHLARDLLRSKAAYEILEVYELRDRGFKPFDYVFFLGVLYHLRHPLLALEIVCALTRDLAIVDSFIVEDDYRGQTGSPIPWMEFYEGTQLSSQVDNWVGPTLECLMALCRSAGFARVELLGVKDQHARVACYRHWEPSPKGASTPPVLAGIFNARAGDNGINFNTRKEEFLALWFTSEESDLRVGDLRPEIGGFGVRPVACVQHGEREWHASVLLPPGLPPGWHEVRLRTAHSGFSNSLRIAVDLPVEASSIDIVSAVDAITYRPGEVIVQDGIGHIALWVAGLAPNCDRNNIRVFYGSRRAAVTFVSLPEPGGAGQVNAQIRVAERPAQIEIVVEHGGQRSNPVSLMIRK